MQLDYRTPGLAHTLRLMALAKLETQLGEYERLLAEHAVLTAEFGAALTRGCWFSGSECVELGQRLFRLERQMTAIEERITDDEARDGR